MHNWGHVPRFQKKKKKAAEARECVARLDFFPGAPECVWSFEGEPRLTVLQHLLSKIAAFSWRWPKS